MEKNENLPMTAPQKVKLLVCIVDIHRAEFYSDLLTSSGISVAYTMIGHGTFASNTFDFLGTGKQGKAVLLAPVSEDRSKEIMIMLTDKFKTVRNGKGIAFTIPMTGTVGVLAYRFICDLRQ